MANSRGLSEVERILVTLRQDIKWVGGAGLNLPVIGPQIRV